MSWTTFCKYACITFQQELHEEEIRSVLASLAPIVLQKHQKAPDRFWSIEEIALDLASKSISEKQALTTISEMLWGYIHQIKTANGKTNLVIRCDDDSEQADDEVAEEIAKHLFSKTGDTHFIMRSVTLDAYGGYSHQWIGYPKNGEVMLMDADDYFQQMFETQPDLMAL